MKRRFLVGQLFHETHGFNPHVTTAAQLTIERGTQLIEKARGTGTTLGGIVQSLESSGHEIVPSLGLMARPSGAIDHALYVRLRDELLEVAGRERCDAIALDLHGAMCTREITDAEGDLLTRLRAIVGDQVPIGIGLDMHAHVTHAMLRAVDVCIACKETPHTDFPECGVRVVECLLAVLGGRLKPVRVMAKAPMINLDSGLTARGPLAEIKARAQALQAADPAIWDISLYQVFRFSDYQEQKGQAVVVLANGSADGACAIAEQLAQQFWENRERFRDELLSVEAAFDVIARDKDRRPYALADTGDRVLAGAPGDSTTILAHALSRTDGLTGVIPITDPVSVELAAVAGVGGRVALSVGGRLTPGFSPVEVSGVVVRIGDGVFRVSGPVLEGETASLGRTAVVLLNDRITLLLTSVPGFTHTPSAFTSQGIDIARQDFIVVKSGVHFQANFRGTVTPLALATPGLTFPSKGFFTWKNAHFWPEQEDLQPAIRASIFESRQERLASPR
jgi:microcystin degradation protein MlrC